MRHPPFEQEYSFVCRWLIARQVRRDLRGEEELEEVAAAVQARYAGLLDRFSFYLQFSPGERDDEWAAARRAVS